MSALRKDLDAWLAETGARIPLPDARFDAAKKERQMKQMREKKLPSLEKQAENFLDPNWKPNADWWSSSAAE